MTWFDFAQQPRSGRGWAIHKRGSPSFLSSLSLLFSDHTTSTSRTADLPHLTISLLLACVSFLVLDDLVSRSKPTPYISLAPTLSLPRSVIPLIPASSLPSPASAAAPTSLASPLSQKMTSWCSYLSDVSRDVWLTMFRPGLRNLPWDPYKDLPSLEGRVIAITGPTSGIGLEAAQTLACSGARTLFLLARSEDKLAKTLTTLQDAQFASGLKHSTRLIPVRCDLSSIKSVRAAAKRVREEEEVLDIFLANAGISGGTGHSEDGLEIQFATNCLGHHILIQELLPSLRRAAHAGITAPTSQRNAESTRIVILTSGAHAWCSEPALRDLGSGGSYNQLLLYGRSKLGNLYTARRLAQTLSSSPTPGDRAITVAAVHPGGIVSDLGRESAFLSKYVVPRFMWPVAPWGIVTMLWAATAAKPEEVHGQYLIPWCRRVEPSAIARDEKLQEHVWAWCEEQNAKLARD